MMQETTVVMETLEYNAGQSVINSRGVSDSGRLNTSLQRHRRAPETALPHSR